MQALIDLLPWALAGDAREKQLYVLTLGVLTAGTLLCVAALRAAVLDVLAVGVACAGAAAWLLCNAPAEGRTLLVVVPGNGVTVADLAVLPVAVLATGLAWRRARQG
ncbi:MAG: hypothetical protein JWN08_3107 [Frankiales bacterium]|nr:hypothetical protein [Frankiales bacterium]